MPKQLEQRLTRNQKKQVVIDAVQLHARLYAHLVEAHVNLVGQVWDSRFLTERERTGWDEGCRNS